METTSPPSAPMRGLRIGAAVAIALYLALPILMTLDPGGVADSVRAQSPGLAAAWLDRVVGYVLAYTWALHVIDIVLLAWFMHAAGRGAAWTRAALTIFLLVATAGSFVSIAAGREFWWAAIGADVVHVIMLALLWIPASMRGHYGRLITAARARRRAQAATTVTPAESN